MYLYTLIVFAILFFRSERPSGDAYGTLWAVASVVGYWTVLFLAAMVVKLLSLRAWRRSTVGGPDLHTRYHKAQLVMNIYLVVGFALLVYATDWPDVCYSLNLNNYLKVVSDVCVVLPYVIGCCLLWGVTFPVDRAMRGDVRMMSGTGDIPGSPRVSLFQHVLLNLRFSVLVIAVPMLLILFASHVVDGHRAVLGRLLFGSPLAPDVVLGVAVLIVFILSPLMLRVVWSTGRLEEGALRDRLEALCRRIGLKYRDILVWKTDGLMINAAVMGLFRPVRYVLLSDGLLQSMDARQIEAVFGHEAGHVRRRHIEFFLVFAFVAMLAVSGILEVLALWRPTISETMFEILGGVLTALLWASGFGFISRRFEREADWFGASCVTPAAEHCSGPCSVHHKNTSDDDVHDGRLCATGAHILATALDRVAVLNGVEHEESSWLHASIGLRIRFLTTLAADPALARRFQRRLRRIKVGLVILALFGGAFAVYYCGWCKPALMTWRPSR